MPAALNLQSARDSVAKKFPDSDATLLTYTRSDEPCDILCPRHGVSTLSRFSHLSTRKILCPKCAKEKAAEKLVKITEKYSNEEYLQKFQELHGDKYTYDMQRDEKSRITLICPEHGSFKIRPFNILERGSYCPGCAREVSNRNLTSYKRKTLKSKAK